MRHRKTKPLLNRPSDQRRSMMRNLLTSLFLYGFVQTTGARAKALSAAAEKLVTLVKGKEDMNAVRELKRVLYTEPSQKAALEYIKKTKKTSGFTRETKIGFRPGDRALKVQVELILEK